MRGNVAANLAMVLLAVFASEIEDLGKRPAIQIVFELGCAVLRVGRRVRRLPVFVIVGLPFALEILFPAAARPELGFLQMDRLGSRIERPFYSQREIPPVILARRNIRDVAIAAMKNQFAVGLRLRLVPMVL